MGASYPSATYLAVLLRPLGMGNGHSRRPLPCQPAIVRALDCLPPASRSVTRATLCGA